jgi:Delta7-sterol 5-desaturase
LNYLSKFETYIPFDLTLGINFFFATLVVMFFILFRYFLIVGIFYLGFYRTKFFQKNFLHKEKPSTAQIKTEISYSLLSSVIFSISGVILGILWQKGYTKLYLNFEQYGYFYLPLSLILWSLVHEAYFYLTHRWMHTPPFYRSIHQVHHLTVNTSPWASFSFHPWEAIIQALILPILAITIPMHPIFLIIYLTIMTLSAVINHLGYETLPEFLREFFISGSHHGDHHKYFNYNYGLWFTFMDRIFKTEYHKRFKPLEQK